MQDAATKRVDDMRQLLDQIAKCAGRRYHCVTARIELFELRFLFFVHRLRERARWAEHPREGTIDCVARSITIRMNRDADVRAIRPMLPALRIDEIRFRFEKTSFGQREFELPAAVLLPHREVMP